MAVAAASQPVLRRLRLVLPHVLRLAPLSRCPRLPSPRFGRLRALVVRRASVARRLPPPGSALRFALPRPPIVWLPAPPVSPPSVRTLAPPVPPVSPAGPLSGAALAAW